MRQESEPEIYVGILTLKSNKGEKKEVMAENLTGWGGSVQIRWVREVATVDGREAMDRAARMF